MITRVSETSFHLRHSSGIQISPYVFGGTAIKVSSSYVGDVQPVAVTQTLPAMFARRPRVYKNDIVMMEAIPGEMSTVLDGAVFNVQSNENENLFSIAYKWYGF